MLNHPDQFKTSLPFSPRLQSKIDSLLVRRQAISLGQVSFASCLLLAPMSSICKAPFRLLMEDLGAGGTVSELISATGIFYQNEQTLSMLYIDPREKNVGLQLFGDNADHMNHAALVSQELGPKFIDINMGCPVRKVVTKGAGSALLRYPSDLGPYLRTIKKNIKLPLTIKIRTGWDKPNAEETLKVAADEGVEFVAIHGRTREQQYRGKANWDYIEELSSTSPLPLIGNGDLHTTHAVRSRMQQTRCQALMIARGCLRNPFIFIEPYATPETQESLFTGEDYLEVLQRFALYLSQIVNQERKVYVGLQKIMVWFAAGFPHAVKFRASIFQSKTLEEMLRLAEDFFCALGRTSKHLDPQENFMNGGHG